MKTDIITVYSVGHGNRSLDELLRLLTTNGIKTLFDIRSYPYSRRFPHFCRDALREALNARGMDYHWAGRQLGGMRKPADPASHPALTEDSLRGFAEYMETDLFDRAIRQLLNLSAAGNTAILCAEKSPDRCHRALICDYLLLKNANVIHLIDDNTRQMHHLCSSVRTDSTRLIYDRHVTANLKLH
jgi:uncharacterized protein (DUF488 family)